MTNYDKYTMKNFKFFSMVKIHFSETRCVLFLGFGLQVCISKAAVEYFIYHKSFNKTFTIL